MYSKLDPYLYTWPREDLSTLPSWHYEEESHTFNRSLPESEKELESDSRWPAFFPSPICFVTTGEDGIAALDKVVGASIVNRFPYVIALSFCRTHLSSRHHVRRVFTELLERTGSAAIQYLPPGAELDRAMTAITTIPETESATRIAETRLSVRKALTNNAPVFDAAYMVYEAKLVRPGVDFSGNAIYEKPWIDVGSHRVYFLEINAIQLRQDIARGESQIHWRALPEWQPTRPLQPTPKNAKGPVQEKKYQKGYNPNYSFPSAGTIAFEADAFLNGMAVKHLPPLPKDQVEVDNDRARWPCFFPSSAGVITMWTSEGKPNIMPCGSTTMLSRNPMIVAPCISYAAINVRYAPRASLKLLRESGKFGCGVPFINDHVLNAIRYAGNVSIDADAEKVANSGLSVRDDPWAPVLPALPIHFDCKIVGEVSLGTHVMFLGEVVRIRVRSDVTAENPLKWFPWASV